MRTFTIEPLHAPSMEACRLRIDNLTKPIYSLATLELIAERFCRHSGRTSTKSFAIWRTLEASDHLVDGQNSQHGSESYAAYQGSNEGRAATQAAFKLNADVHVVNVGLEQDTSNLEYIDQQVIRKGSHFFGIEPAISQEELESALELDSPMLINYTTMDCKSLLLVILVNEHSFDSLVTTATITGCEFKGYSRSY